MAHRTCSIDGCGRPHHARGWCKNHYQHAAEYGSPFPRTAIERFWEKVEITPTCWVWRGSLTFGYGSFFVNGRCTRAHRWLYQEMVGPVPDGLNLDHLCRNRACVRPDHLEPVSQRENVLRGLNGRLKTYCSKGHPWSGDNVAINKLGYGRCRTCNREDSRRRYRAA